MDWQGQKLSEQLMQYIIFVAAAVSFLVGYLLSSYKTMMVLYAGGVVLAFLVTVPNWSYFNRQPLDWLPPQPAAPVVPEKAKVVKKVGKSRR